MKFDINITSLNDALKLLSYVDVFKDKNCSANEFIIRLAEGHECDGIVGLAENEGYVLLGKELDDDSGDLLLRFRASIPVECVSTKDHLMKIK